MSESLREGIEAFDEALEVDDRLSEISSMIEEQKVVEPYLADEEVVFDVEDQDQSPNESEILLEERELPEPVEEAHKKLRNAADRMSLAMHMDNRFLFMGDLMDADIGCAVNHLLEKERSHFFLLITPHHGTRWHNSMNKLSSVWAVSSAGQGNLRTIKPKKFRTICDHNWVTHLNGDLVIPAYMMWNPHISRMSKWPYA